MVEANLKSYEAWGRSGGRKYYMVRLFRSLCILEKQQFLPESALNLFWGFEGLGELEVKEVMRKFTDLNLVKRERVDGCIFNEEPFCIRLHDFVLGLCKTMKIDEQQVWHICLINAYRSALEDGKVMKKHSRAWLNTEYDGHIFRNLSRHLIASGCRKELEALMCDVRRTLRRYKMGGWAVLDLDFKQLLADEVGSVGY